MSLREKGLVFVVGPSGSGKTTLLNLIGGLDRADSGEIIVNGNDITKYNERELNEYRGRRIGFVFQEYNVINHLSVYENIQLSQSVLGMPSDETEMNELLESLGILDLKNRRADEISGGQRQRVAIARALLKKSEIILADEPTGALDEETSNELMRQIKRVSKRSLVIVVSHDKELARKYADRIIELSNGEIVSDYINEPSFTRDKDGIFKKPPGIFEQNLTFHKLTFKDLFRIWNLEYTTRITRLFLLLFTLIITATSIGTLFSFSQIDYSDTYMKAMYNNDNFFYSILNDSGSELTILDIETIKRTLGTSDMYTIHELGNEGNFQFVLGDLPNTKFYSRASAFGFMEMDAEIATDFHFTLLGNSSFPSDDNEVLISLYMYQYFLASGYRDPLTNQIIEIDNYDDLIRKKIGSWESIIAGEGLTITGIIDTNFNDSKYDFLKDVSVNETINTNVDDSYLAYIQNSSPHTLVYVNNGFFSRRESSPILSLATVLTGNIRLDEKIYSYFNSNSEPYVHIDDISNDLIRVKDTFSSLEIFFVVGLAIMIVILASSSIGFFSSIFFQQRKMIRLFKALGIRKRLLVVTSQLGPLIISFVASVFSGILLYMFLNLIDSELSLRFGFDFVLAPFKAMTVFVMFLVVNFIVAVSALISLRKSYLNV
ncbi:MAG: ABC transporter ATP-binding protein/permease [Candidatus Izemoplasmatales bacterium]|nr:ABC transporter ATP-binding protein/permease [Candidatus Izemoplasmatales bacterium]